MISRTPIGVVKMLASVLLSFLTLWGPATSASSDHGATATANVVADPYAALRLYDGKWDVQSATSDKPAETVHLENRCAKVGEFFACNQYVGGKSMALVVFYPLHPLENGGYAYRNQALRPDGDDPSNWGSLEINGDRWVYSGGDKEKKVYWRTTNMFSGADKIHFEVQRSEDGMKWTTTMAGDEVRSK
jgi:hypothetical protein